MWGREAEESESSSESWEAMGIVLRSLQEESMGDRPRAALAEATVWRKRRREIFPDRRDSEAEARRFFLRFILVGIGVEERLMELGIGEPESGLFCGVESSWIQEKTAILIHSHPIGE